MCCYFVRLYLIRSRIEDVVKYRRWKNQRRNNVKPLPIVEARRSSGLVRYVADFLDPH